MDEMVELCNERWRNAWQPGTYLVADETMIFWVGAAPHLTYLPRKPTPLGVMMKTLVDAGTGIMLTCEIDKGKAAMQQAKFREVWGHTTATTLRLTEPYWGKKKVLAADAWFGGLRCSYAL